MYIHIFCTVTCSALWLILLFLSQLVNWRTYNLKLLGLVFRGTHRYLYSLAYQHISNTRGHLLYRLLIHQVEPLHTLRQSYFPSSDVAVAETKVKSVIFQFVQLMWSRINLAVCLEESGAYNFSITYRIRSVSELYHILIRKHN